MIWVKVLCTLRVRASSSVDSSSTSGIGSIRATRYGCSVTYSTMLMRSAPWTRIRRVPSGIFIIRATVPATPTS